MAAKAAVVCALGVAACGSDPTPPPEPGSLSGDLLMVANKDAASVSFIDLASGATAAALPTGAGPHEIALSRDGALAVVSNYGQQVPGSSLTVIDVPGRAVLRTVSVSPHQRPHGIAFLPDGERVVVTSEASQAVLVVNVHTGVVEHVLATDRPATHQLALAPDGRFVYTANILAGNVSRLTLTNPIATPATRFVAGTGPAGSGPEGIDVSPDGRELWVANQGSGTVAIFAADQAGAFASIATVPASSGGAVPIRLRFTPDGRRVLVSNLVGSSLTIHDAATRAVLRTVAIPLDLSRAKPAPPQLQGSALPVGIVTSPDGARAYVALTRTDQIVEVDVERGTILRTIATGLGPDGMAYLKKS